MWRTTIVSLLRRKPSQWLLKRSFADQVAQGSEKLKLGFATPTHALRKDALVDMVVFPAATGMMGVLPQHVPTVAQLKPGVVTVVEDGKEDKYFVSSGFAFVTKERTDILAVEAVRLEDLDKEAVQRGSCTPFVHFRGIYDFRITSIKYFCACSNVRKQILPNHRTSFLQRSYSSNPELTSFMTLAEQAHSVLTTASPNRKASLTQLFYRNIQQKQEQNKANEIALGLEMGLQAPLHPARPEKPKLVSPREMPGHKALNVSLSVYLLHSLAHIELNAIDLAWDTVFRFLSPQMPIQFYTDFVFLFVLFLKRTSITM